MPMVVRVRLALTGEGRATPAGARAVLARWLDSPEPAHRAAMVGEPDEWWPLGRPGEPEHEGSSHRASTKPWSIVGLDNDSGVVSLDVGLMDASSVEQGTLALRLAQFASRHLVRPSNLERFGSTRFTTIPTVTPDGRAAGIEVLGAVDWHDLTTAPPVAQWRWEFSSRTASETDRGPNPLYDPRAVLRDLQRSWLAFCPEDLRGAAAAVWDVDGASLSTPEADIRIAGSARIEQAGFVGWARHGASARDGHDPALMKQALGTLLRFGPYRGVGARTTLGKGQLAVMLED